MCEEYNGWANRETWAIALYINNDQGWQESVHDALREAIKDNPTPDDETDGVTAYRAGEIVRDNVETTFDWSNYYVSESATRGYGDHYTIPSGLLAARDDIGSLYRVDWTELGAAFLTDLAEQS